MKKSHKMEASSGSTVMCGACLHKASSVEDLESHFDICPKRPPGPLSSDDSDPDDPAPSASLPSRQTGRSTTATTAAASSAQNVSPRWLPVGPDTIDDIYEFICAFPSLTPSSHEGYEIPGEGYEIPGEGYEILSIWG